MYQNIFIKFIFSLLSVVIISLTPANAALVLVTGSPVAGNDSVAALQSDFAVTTTLLGRINTPGSTEDGAVDASAVFSITPNTGTQSGTFTYDLTGTGFQLDYVALKGGPQYSLFTLMVGSSPTVGVLAWAMADTGITVGNGNIPDLSHITFYGSFVPPSNVPLPAAAPFFLMGLVGAGLFGRKKNNVH